MLEWAVSPGLPGLSGASGSWGYVACVGNRAVEFLDFNQ